MIEFKKDETLISGRKYRKRNGDVSGEILSRTDEKPLIYLFQDASNKESYTSDGLLFDGSTNDADLVQLHVEGEPRLSKGDRVAVEGYEAPCTVAEVSLNSVYVGWCGRDSGFTWVPRDKVTPYREAEVKPVCPPPLAVGQVWRRRLDGRRVTVIKKEGHLFLGRSLLVLENGEAALTWYRANGEAVLSKYKDIGAPDYDLIDYLGLAPMIPISYIGAPNSVPVFMSTDSDTRKKMPIATGCVAYFKDALKLVSWVSRVGNDKHNTGEPLHWDKAKSPDEKDAELRHMIDAIEGAPADPGLEELGNLGHLASKAWRALADLQRACDAEREAYEKAGKL